MVRESTGLPFKISEKSVFFGNFRFGLTPNFIRFRAIFQARGTENCRSSPVRAGAISHRIRMDQGLLPTSQSPTKGYRPCHSGVGIRTKFLFLSDRRPSRGPNFSACPTESRAEPNCPIVRKSLGSALGSRAFFRTNSDSRTAEVPRL